MHLDLKSPNILLAADYTAKIADVGLSRIFTTQSMPVAMVSTPANCYSVAIEHTARCSITVMHALLPAYILLSCCVIHCKHVQQQLQRYIDHLLRRTHQAEVIMCTMKCILL